jgi:PAS domain S-box-containing protein
LLQASERRLRAILNAAADAIITIDKAGIINGINPATERMFGYRQDELVGQNINLLMSPPYSDEPEGNITRYLETGEPNIMASGREVTARRKDGVTFPIDLALSEVEQLGLFIGMIRDISERKELQRRVLEIAAEEQRRIGLELHDGTGQTLTGLSLFAGTMLDVLNIAERNESRGMVRWVFNDAEYQRLCAATARLAKGLGEANRHVHQLSHGIMPVQIDAEGLRSALEELAVSTNVQENMTCCFECSGSVAVKNNTTAMHLYRIAQEALNNAVRHGQADQIQILLLQIDDQVILEVADNGVGIDRSGRGRNGPAHGGMGLRIMDYRAGMIGGVLDVERNKTGGTTVRCAVSGA